MDNNSCDSSKKAEERAEDKKSVEPCKEVSVIGPDDDDPPTIYCRCHSETQANKTTSPGQSSLDSRWSFEQVAQASYPGPVPYSEQTKRQLEDIQKLVQEQEKETAERVARKETDIGKETTKEPGRELGVQISTTFGQAMEWIEEQIRKGHEEQEREAAQKRLECEMKKKKKREENQMK